jgi:hypothetical protein
MPPSRPVSDSSVHVGGARRLLVAFALVLLATLTFAGSASAGGDTITGEPTPYVDISSAGPLEDIYVGNDLSCQIEREGTLELYSGYPGDCGTMVAYGGVLYTPDFEDHEGTSQEGELENSATPFDSKALVTQEEVEAAPAAEHNQAYTPISQSAVTGTGTEANPLKVVTVVQAGTKVRISQTDSYVVGQDYYTVAIVTENLTSSPLEVELYRGQDCYLNGVDDGYGVAGSGECSTTQNNEPAGYVEALVPSSTPASHYLETGYFSNWAAIGTRQPLSDSCDCETYEDNGDSVSWSLTLPSAGTQAVSVEHVFSLTGTIPAAPPAPSVAPTVSTGPSISPVGPPAVGQSLTGAQGSYPGAESYSYQWLRCTNADPASCTPIGGAISTTYTPTAADAGDYLEFVVTATNSSGSVLGQATLVGPVAVIATPTTVSSKVSPAACSSTRTETLHWQTKVGVRLASVSITLNGRTVRHLSGAARSAKISMVGLPAGKVTIKIRGRTRFGKTYTNTRVYEPCRGVPTDLGAASLFLRRS